MKRILLLIGAVFLISGTAFGQILTFENSSLTGSEANTTSSSNDSNISTSTLSRGAGINASNNGGRFNANSHSTEATLVTGDNSYFTFNITPNSGFSFSVTSIVFNFQRSGTGPKSFALRSSADSFASDLDDAVTIDDNTSTHVLTFTFTLEDITADTEFRLYTYNAESTGGSGGIGDGSGDDITVNGTTESTGGAPTKFSITSINDGSSATSGTGFDVVIELQDSGDSPTVATQDTSVTLTLTTGTGALGGTLTGTVLSGNSTTTISGVTYDTAESGVSITATNTGGSLTAATSSTFTVLGEPTKLVLSGFPSTGLSSTAIDEFTVEVQRADNSVDLNSSASIAIAINSGTGNLSGTTPVSASDGVATFSDISFDAADDFTVTVSSTGLSSATSGTITISTVVAPTAGTVFITEVADADNDFNAEFIELYNSGSDGVTLASTDLLRYSGDGTGSAEFTFDISAGTGSSIIPANGFLIIARGATEAEFEAEWGTLESNTNFNEGSSSLFFGNGRRWVVKESSTVIDSTSNAVGTNRDFQFPVGSGTFITGIQSDATPGLLDGEIEISGTAGWRLLSIPKTSATGADISDDGMAAQFTANTDSATIYTYDNTGAYEAISSDASAFTDGFGLAVYFFDNTNAGSSELPLTLDITGTEPSSDVTIDLNKATTSGGANHYFTLAGNPFAFNYDLNSLTTDAGSLQDNAHFWNNGTGTYDTGDRTANYIVSPWQGFWLEVENAGAATQATFPTSGKSTSATSGNFFSKTAENRGDIAFTLTTENSFDKAIKLAVREYATLGMDRADASKLVPLSPTYATMAFKSEELLKSVESLPWDLNEEVSLDLELTQVGIDGGFTFDWTGLGSIPSDWKLTFHDFEEGTAIDMRTETKYVFDATAPVVEKVNPINTLTGSIATAQKSKSAGSRFGITITPNTTSVNNEEPGKVESFALDQNYPNPFNPTTTINYSVENTGAVTLSVYNLMGQKVAELVNETKSAGSYNVSWNASQAASGMYYYRLEAGGQTLTRKMTLIK